MFILLNKILGDGTCNLFNEKKFHVELEQLLVFSPSVSRFLLNWCMCVFVVYSFGAFVCLCFAFVSHSFLSVRLSLQPIVCSAYTYAAFRNDQKRRNYRQRVVNRHTKLRKLCVRVENRKTVSNDHS